MPDSHRIGADILVVSLILSLGLTLASKETVPINCKVPNRTCFPGLPSRLSYHPLLQHINPLQKNARLHRATVQVLSRMAVHHRRNICSFCIAWGLCQDALVSIVVGESLMGRLGHRTVQMFYI